MTDLSALDTDWEHVIELRDADDEDARLGLFTTRTGDGGKTAVIEFRTEIERRAFVLRPGDGKRLAELLEDWS